MCTSSAVCVLAVKVKFLRVEDGANFTLLRESVVDLRNALAAATSAKDDRLSPIHSHLCSAVKAGLRLPQHCTPFARLLSIPPFPFPSSPPVAPASPAHVRRERAFCRAARPRHSRPAAGCQRSQGACQRARPLRRYREPRQGRALRRRGWGEGGRPPLCCHRKKEATEREWRCCGPCVMDCVWACPSRPHLGAHNIDRHRVPCHVGPAHHGKSANPQGCLAALPIPTLHARRRWPSRTSCWPRHVLSASRGNASASCRSSSVSHRRPSRRSRHSTRQHATSNASGSPFTTGRSATRAREGKW